MDTLIDAAEGRVLGYTAAGPTGKRPYVEGDAHGVALPAHPEADAWTPKQLRAACERLHALLNHSDARVSVGLTISPYNDGRSPHLSIYPRGVCGPHLYVASTDFASLFAEGERHIADYRAYAQSRAREALAQARAEAERLGVAETV